jgi:hypothetical protein
VVLHHADAVVWDANQGKNVNSSSTVGSAAAGNSSTPRPVGIGVTDVTGAQVYSTLFPGTTIREDAAGRIGTVIAVTSYPTGSAEGQETPGLVCTLLFGKGQPDEQAATLVCSGRYTANNGIGLLSVSESADGTRAASFCIGILTDGGSFGTTHGFATLLAGAAAAQSVFGPALFYQAGASSNLIASIAASAGTDPFGNAYLAGITSQDNATGVILNLLNGLLSIGTQAHINSGLEAYVAAADPFGGGLTLDSGKQSALDTDCQVQIKSAAHSSTVAMMEILGSLLVDVGIMVTSTGGQQLILTSTSTPGTPISQIAADAAGHLAFGISVTGDANDRFLMDSTGEMNWGNGTAGVDTNLYRATANKLQTDDNFEVGGTLEVVGVSSLDGGTNTSSGVTVRTPGLANGTPGQLGDTTRDYMVYLQIGTPGTAFSLKIGAGNPPGNTIYTSATPPAGLLLSFRLPAGWWIQWGGTGTTLASQRAVSC